jgi:gliding motility-associated-like protein
MMKLFFPVILLFSVVFLCGCSTSGDLITHVNCDGLVTDTLGTNDNGRIYIPNAFTPNGDGLNEIYRPFTQNIDSIQFTIYDESNTVVFNSNLLGDGWLAPPPPLPIKRYYYKIQATTTSHHKIGVCGDVYAMTCYTINPPRSFYYFEDMLTPNGFTGPTAETLSTCP